MPSVAEVDLTRERQVALEAVRAASLLCRDVRATLAPDDQSRKSDHSPITVADLGSQALVTLALADAFPGDPIVAEEDASLVRAEPASAIAVTVERIVASARGTVDAAAIATALDRGAHAGGRDGRFWTLDPVDGTKGFLRGGQYAVALALIAEGEVVLGVLGCPALPIDAGAPDGPRGTVFVAQRGAGAWSLPLEDAADAGRPVRVRRPSTLAEAGWTESVEAGHSALGRAARVMERLGVGTDPQRMDSQAKYATVARGDAAIYLRLPVTGTYRERVWDHAAGWLLVREAGGEVTDVHGRALDFGCGRTLERNAGIVATCGGTVHEQVLDAVAHVLAAHH